MVEQAPPLTGQAVGADDASYKPAGLSARTQAVISAGCMFATRAGSRGGRGIKHVAKVAVGAGNGLLAVAI